MGRNLKILHVTYWYPHKNNQNEAIWIKNHIDSLNLLVASQSVFHFEIRYAKQFSLNACKPSPAHSTLQLAGPLPWWLIEIISFIGLGFLLLVKARRFNVINVHIAYPLLTYFHLIKKWVKKPVVVTEHWSGYHFNFGVKKKLPRIQRIFKNNFPLIAVSESLLSDLRMFSNQPLLESCIVPNVVDAEIFHRYEMYSSGAPSFFMLSQWKWPKRPEVIIKAFSELVQMKEYSGYQLRIGGYGPRLKEIQKLIDSLKLKGNIILLGKLAPEAISREMNYCSAFLHCSEYETFSVVCAEALACGAPVIASNVGGIPEFVGSEDGVLVKTNEVADWLLALKEFDDRNFDRASISAAANERFSGKKAGLKYFNFLKDACETY